MYRHSQKNSNKHNSMACLEIWKSRSTEILSFLHEYKIWILIEAGMSHIFIFCTSGIKPCSGWLKSQQLVFSHLFCFCSSNPSKNATKLPSGWTTLSGAMDSLSDACGGLCVRSRLSWPVFSLGLFTWGHGYTACYLSEGAGFEPIKAMTGLC